MQLSILLNYKLDQLVGCLLPLFTDCIQRFRCKPRSVLFLNPFAAPGGETHLAITQQHDENRGKNGADRYTPPALIFDLSIPASPPASGVPATDGNFLTSVMDFG